MDVEWLADGSLLTLQAAGADSVVKRWDSSFSLVDEASYPSAPLAVRPVPGGMLVVTHDGVPRFHVQGEPAD